MSQRMDVTATWTKDMVAEVEVPDGWSEQDVIEWYRANNAEGEFTEDGMGSWEWGDATLVPANRRHTLPDRKIP